MRIVATLLLLLSVLFVCLFVCTENTVQMNITPSKFDTQKHFQAGLYKKWTYITLVLQLLLLRVVLLRSVARSSPRCRKIDRCSEKNCSNFSFLTCAFVCDSSVERLSLRLSVLNQNPVFQIPFYICF